MAKRLFLAICPPMSLTQTIAQSIRLPIDCRPVPAENYHVTLVFLGLVEPEVFAYLNLLVFLPGCGMTLFRNGTFNRGE